MCSKLKAASHHPAETLWFSICVTGKEPGCLMLGFADENIRGGLWRRAQSKSEVMSFHILISCCVYTVCCFSFSQNSNTVAFQEVRSWDSTFVCCRMVRLATMATSPFFPEDAEIYFTKDRTGLEGICICLSKSKAMQLGHEKTLFKGLWSEAAEKQNAGLLNNFVFICIVSTFVKNSRCTYQQNSYVDVNSLQMFLGLWLLCGTMAFNLHPIPVPTTLLVLASHQERLRTQHEGMHQSRPNIFPCNNATKQATSKNSESSKLETKIAERLQAQQVLPVCRSNTSLLNCLPWEFYTAICLFLTSEVPSCRLQEF